jgi:tRNA(adenine34) deaminase
LQTDLFFMRLALEEAEKAYGLQEVPVGAVLVGAEGLVLAGAHNMPISSHDPTAHAEVVAIRQASRRLGNYRLSGTVMYVTLEPCAMCVGAMLHARVGSLVFGARDPRSGCAGSVLDLSAVDRFNHRIEVRGGVLGEECADLLHRFFKARRGAK